MNHLHKWQLVEAEKTRVLGKDPKAMELYDLAIAGAQENEYIQEEALAYDLAAKFYLSKGKTLIAQAYMTEARYRYLKWGALAKVKHLDDTYPKLLNIPSRSENEQSTETIPTTEFPYTAQTIQTEQANSTTTPSSKTREGSQKLDLNTIMKSSQTILTAVERASKTVFALKNYAHYDRSGEKIVANLFEGIETVLTLYHNQIKQGVEVSVKGFEDIPAIPCYPDELNQVWTNLTHNALQAMDHKGKLEIEARQGRSVNENGDENKNEDDSGEYVIISFTDNGRGIPEENLKRIFGILQKYFTLFWSIPHF